MSSLLHGFSIQEPMGPPEFYSISLSACHGLRTPADLPIQAIMDVLVLPSVYVKTLGIRNSSFRSCTSTSGSAISPTAYRIPCVRFTCFVRPVLLLKDSATGATLGMGGWLTLTLRGLAPRQICRASLGATTLRITGPKRNLPISLNMAMMVA